MLSTFLLLTGSVQSGQQHCKIGRWSSNQVFKADTKSKYFMVEWSGSRPMQKHLSNWLSIQLEVTRIGKKPIFFQSFKPLSFVASDFKAPKKMTKTQLLTQRLMTQILVTQSLMTYLNGTWSLMLKVSQLIVSQLKVSRLEVSRLKVPLLKVSQLKVDS